MRKIGMCLFLVVLFCSVKCWADSWISPFFTTGLDIRAARSVYRVSNIPLFIRDVSYIHPDGWIEEDTIKIPHEFDWISGMIGIEMGRPKFNIRLGLKSRFAMGNHVGKEDLGSHQVVDKVYKTEEIPICDECGYPAGTEVIHYFTYYGIEMKEYLTSEPYLEIRRGNFYIGTSFRQFYLQSESGWYKSGEKGNLHARRHHTLARIRETNVVLGIEGTEPVNPKKNKKNLIRMGGYIGATFLDNPKMFSVAEDAEVEYDKTSIFVGLNFLFDIF